MKSIIKKITILSVVVLSLLIANRSWAATSQAVIVDKGQANGSTSGTYVQKIEITPIAPHSVESNLVLQIVKYPDIPQGTLSVKIPPGTAPVFITTPELYPGSYGIALYEGTTISSTTLASNTLVFVLTAPSTTPFTIPDITITDNGQAVGSVSGKYIQKFKVVADEPLAVAFDISLVIKNKDPAMGNVSPVAVTLPKGIGDVFVSSGDLDPGTYRVFVGGDYFDSNVLPFTIQSVTPPTVTGGGQEKVPLQAKCGAADGGTFSTAPDNALCDSLSTASSVTPAPSSGWNWTCVITPYAPVNCSANQSATAPKGSDPIKAPTQGTGSGSVNLGGKPDFGPQNDPNKKDDTTKKDDPAANPAKNYLQNPFKNLDTFPKIIKAVVNNIILPVAVPFIAIMIIYSGFLFVIAKKDGKVYSIERAKNTLKNTLIGAGLILGAFVIANALQATLNALLK
jgi:hypothetical protein